MDNTEKVCLGSGKLYVVVADEMPTDTVFETDTNRLGDIQGGAALKYEPEFYEVNDDLGLVKEVYLTKETVTLTSGILTWNGKTLQKLCATARVTDGTGKRTIKVGGIGNFTNTKYFIRFVHTNGNKVTIYGQNKGGFELAYAPDKETVINAEFTASAMDTDGTLIQFDEVVPTTAAETTGE